MPRSKGVNRTTGDLIDGSRRRAKAAAGSNLDIRIEVNDRSEILGETRIRATVATVFVLLTQAHQIKTWFAHYAEADAPVPSLGW